MSKIVTFFKKIGSALKFVWSGVEKVIPDEQIIQGVEYAEEAAKRFVTKPEMRTWVITQLMARFGIGENIARIITELAVFQMKKGIEAGADKIEDEVRDHE